MTTRPELLLEMVGMLKVLFLESQGWKHRDHSFFPPDEANWLGPFTADVAFAEARATYALASASAVAKVLTEVEALRQRAEQAEDLCRRLQDLLRLRGDEVASAAHAEAQRLGLTLAFGPGWRCKILRGGAIVAQIQSGDGHIECLYEVLRWLAGWALSARPPAPLGIVVGDNEDT